MTYQGRKRMNILFAEILKKLRTEKGLSQRELAEWMYVTRSTVARWETGSRLPDAAMISRLARCLDTDVNTLLSAAAKREKASKPTDGLVSAQAPDAPQLRRPTPMDGLVSAQAPDAPFLRRPNVIMVDDRKIFLSGALPVLEEALPWAAITVFTKPSEALDFARENPVALAFLDIEMGKMSGLDLCRKLLALNPCTNVVYLTAYIEYSFDAWSTGASGFLLKPLTTEAVRAQLKNLRHPFMAEGADADE